MTTEIEKMMKVAGVPMDSPKIKQLLERETLQALTESQNHQAIIQAAQAFGDALATVIDVDEYRGGRYQAQPGTVANSIAKSGKIRTAEGEIEWLKIVTAEIKAALQDTQMM